MDKINRTNTNTGTCSVGTTFTQSGGTSRVMNNSGTGAVLGTLTISGNTIISGGTLDLSAAGVTNGGRLFLRGDLTVSSGTLLYTQALTGSSASSGIYFDGNGKIIYRFFIFFLNMIDTASIEPCHQVSGI